MTRDEFKLALHMAINPDREVLRGRHHAAVLAAWDAQAAEVERLRAEVEALRAGVPLTAENAPRASLVGYRGMILEQHEFLPGKFG